MVNSLKRFIWIELGVDDIAFIFVSIAFFMKFSFKIFNINFYTLQLAIMFFENFSAKIVCSNLNRVVIKIPTECCWKLKRNIRPDNLSTIRWILLLLKFPFHGSYKKGNLFVHQYEDYEETSETHFGPLKRFLGENWQKMLA